MSSNNLFYDILPCDLQIKIENMSLGLLRNDHRNNGYNNVISEFNTSMEYVYKQVYSETMFDLDFENSFTSYQWFYEDNILHMSPFVEKLNNIIKVDTKDYLILKNLDDETCVMKLQDWWNKINIEYADNNGGYDANYFADYINDYQNTEDFGYVRGDFI